MRIMQALSRVVTCPDACASCRAVCAALLESDVLGPIVDCPKCGLPWAESLGPCRCQAQADIVDATPNPWERVSA